MPKLYAATLRMIDSAHAIAEIWTNEWAREYKPGKPGYDGTVQISIEELSDDQHISIPDEMLYETIVRYEGVKDIVDALQEKINQALDIAHQQGYAQAVREQVTYDKWGNDGH